MHTPLERYLYKDIHQKQRKNRHEEKRSGVAEDKECGDDFHGAVQPAVETHGQRGVDHLEIFAEPVHQPTERNAVKKVERTAQNVLNQVRVQTLARPRTAVRNQNVV